MATQEKLLKNIRNRIIEAYVEGIYIGIDIANKKLEQENIKLELPKKATVLAITKIKYGI